MVGEIFGALIALLRGVLVVFAWLIRVVEVPAKQWVVRVKGLACILLGGICSALRCGLTRKISTTIRTGGLWGLPGEAASRQHDVHP